MKRALLRALALLLALAAMFLGGSVRAMPPIIDPATLPTRSPSMSAMQAEAVCHGREGHKADAQLLQGREEGGVLPGAEAPAEG